MSDITQALGVETLPAGVFDLRGKTYFGPNGVKIDFEEVPENSILTAWYRTCRHVFSNEAVSKVSAEKARRRKAGEVPMTEDQEADLLETSVENYRGLITTPGKWSFERSEAEPSESRIDYFRRKVAEALVLEIIRAKKVKKGDDVKVDGRTEPTYIQNNVAHALSSWVKAYKEHKVEGPDRCANIEALAQKALAEDEAKKAEKRAMKEAAISAPEIEI